MEALQLIILAKVWNLFQFLTFGASPKSITNQPPKGFQKQITMVGFKPVFILVLKVERSV